MCVWNDDLLAMDEQEVSTHVCIAKCLNAFEGVIGRCLTQYEVVIVSDPHVLSKYNTMAITALHS